MSRGTDNGGEFTGCATGVIGLNNGMTGDETLPEAGSGVTLFADLSAVMNALEGSAGALETTECLNGIVGFETLTGPTVSGIPAGIMRCLASLPGVIGLECLPDASGFTADFVCAIWL